MLSHAPYLPTRLLPCSGKGSTILEILKLVRVRTGSELFAFARLSDSPTAPTVELACTGVTWLWVKIKPGDHRF